MTIDKYKLKNYNYTILKIAKIELISDKNCSLNIKNNQMY